MKPVFVLLLAGLLTVSCKTQKGFLSANEVHHIKGTLVFNNHQKSTGLLDIPFESPLTQQTVNRPWIMFTPEGTDTARKVTLNTIEGYWVDSNYYMLKKVDISLDGSSQLLFVKRLTKEGSKIQLFEAAAAGPATERTGDDRSYYFLSFPGYGLLQTINSRSSEIVPGFERKMSLRVIDCPVLAKKIIAKEEGYFLPMASIKKNQIPDVLLRVINEFNTCQ